MRWWSRLEFTFAHHCEGNKYSYIRNSVCYEASAAPFDPEVQWQLKNKADTVSE